MVSNELIGGHQFAFDVAAALLGAGLVAAQVLLRSTPRPAESPLPLDRSDDWQLGDVA